MDRINRRQLIGHAGATFGLALLGSSPRSLGTDAPPVGLLQQAGALADLRDRLEGSLLLQGNGAYGAASTPANSRYNGVRPLAVAQCVSERDVMTCVNWSREQGESPVARGGGHSFAGYSTTTGLLIDIGLLNMVTIDRSRGTATVGGGALNADLLGATVDGPLFLPVGSCLGVGIGGLALGGGIGYNTHWAGLTCDHLVATEMVTASGDLLQVDASHHPDLYWACRGAAGGSLGINTSFTFELVEAPQKNIAWYRFDWRGADAAAAVFAAFHRMLQESPPALNALAMAQASEIGAGGPREAIDVMSRGQYIGPLDDLRDLVGPLLAAAAPVQQTLQEQTFWDTARMTAEPESPPFSFSASSRYAAEPLPDKAIGELVDLLSACPSRSEAANGSLWSFGEVGGDIVNSLGRTDTGYVHRNVLNLFRPTAIWPNTAPESVAQDLIAWTDETIAALEPYTLDESYQNFPNRDLDNWLERYYGENLGRLVAVKAQYDKDNLFHNPQSIPPQLATNATGHRYKTARGR